MFNKVRIDTDTGNSCKCRNAEALKLSSGCGKLPHIAPCTHNMQSLPRDIVVNKQFQLRRNLKIIRVIDSSPNYYSHYEAQARCW